MVPSKVIHMHDARRRVAQAKRKRQAPQRSALSQRISAWMSVDTTRGSALLAGAVACLLTGVLVAAIFSAPRPSAVAEGPGAAAEVSLP